MSNTEKRPDYRKSKAAWRIKKYPEVYQQSLALQNAFDKIGFRWHNPFSDECNADFSCCSAPELSPQGREEEVKEVEEANAHLGGKIYDLQQRIEELEKELNEKQDSIEFHAELAAERFNECVDYQETLASLRSTISHHEKVIAEREESINLLDKELREQGRKIAEQTWDAAAAYVEYDPEIDKMPRPMDKVAYLKQFEEGK